MKIIYSVFTTGWGGLEKYPLTLVEELSIKGHEIIIVTIEGTKLHSEAVKKGIKSYTIKKFSKLSYKIISELKKIVEIEKADIVHLNSSRELYNWYFALKRVKNIKVFLTFHIGIPNHRGIIHKILYERVDGVIAISSKEFKEMREKLRIDKDKIFKLYNGIDLKKFNTNIKSDFKKELGIDNEKRLITSIGNISKPKGILELIAAAELIIKEYSDVVFVWVGDDTHVKEEYSLKTLKENIENKGMSKKIILAGYRNDIREILKETDIFVLPAYNESFGIVYIEAMAMGIPVIGCNSGGVPDIIKEGTGFLCEPKNSNSLYETIKTALSVNLDEIRENNKKYVEKFSMEKHIENLLKIYMNN